MEQKLVQRCENKVDGDDFKASYCFYLSYSYELPHGMGEALSLWITNPQSISKRNWLVMLIKASYYPLSNGIQLAQQTKRKYKDHLRNMRTNYRDVIPVWVSFFVQ